MAAGNDFAAQVARAIAGVKSDLQKLVAGHAERELARIVAAADPKPSKVRTIIDGVEGRPLSAMRWDGSARFEFEYNPIEAVQYAGTLLRAQSPVLTGLYQRSHVVMLDGVELGPLVAGGRFPILEQAVPGREIVIVNVQPYAGMIEDGRSRMAPDGVYRVTVPALQRRFGNVIDARFEWRAGIGDRPDVRLPGMVIRER